MSDTPQRRVVCAANRLQTGILLGSPETYLVCSARHFDPLMRAQIAMRPEGVHAWKTSEQGFIDQWGVFMDRKEALAVALAAGQRIRRCGGDEEQLYSECLY